MRLHTLIPAFIFAGITILSAQTQQEYEDFLKSGIKLSTKEIVYEELALTPAEVEAFDAVFDAYLEKRGAIAQERLPILAEYALNAPTMSEEALQEFNAYLIKSNKQLSSLNKKYYNKSRKVIPIQKATQLFLVEKYLRNEVEMEMIESLFSF
jgi:hypothetical protein